MVLFAQLVCTFSPQSSVMNTCFNSVWQWILKLLGIEHFGSRDG